MGFELTVIVSSPLSAERRNVLRRVALERWPFLRVPVFDVHPERLVLGSVERTSYMLTDHALVAAIEDQLDDGLRRLSADFPEISLARVHTDCFGGLCEDDCTIWRAGERALTGNRLVDALAEVHLESTGNFAPFERDHFGPNFTPRPYAHRFEHLHDQELDSDVDDIEADGPRLPDRGWLARTLAHAHEPSFDPFERALLGHLDQPDRADDAWRVLGDWLAQRGDPAAQAVQLDVTLDHDATEHSRARALHAAGLDASAPLATFAHERQPGPVTVKIGPWAPQLWLDWRGPFLARLVVQHAWADQRQPGYAGWLHHQHRDRALLELGTLLALPCARYLSPTRVSLLACPFAPSLEGRDLRGFRFDESLIAYRPESDSNRNCRDTAQLRATRLDGASLRGISAVRADLRQSSLVDADLSEAELRQADLRDADLRRAKLIGVDLRCADLRGARLDGAQLDGALLDGVLADAGF